MLLTCLICFISTIFGTNSLNSADVLLSNKQTKLARVERFLCMRPLQSPFSMQTHFIHVFFHTFIPSLPAPASISYSFNFKTCTCWNPIITIFSLHIPNHRSLLRLITSVMHSVLSWLLSWARAFLLFKWKPHIHLTIFRSVLSNIAISSTFIAQVLLAYPKILGIQALYTFLFTLREILDSSTGARSLNFAQAQCTLALLLLHQYQPSLPNNRTRLHIPTYQVN